MSDKEGKWSVHLLQCSADTGFPDQRTSYASILGTKKLSPCPCSLKKERIYMAMLGAGRGKPAGTFATFGKFGLALVMEM